MPSHGDSLKLDAENVFNYIYCKKVIFQLNFVKQQLYLKVALKKVNSPLICQSLPPHNNHLNWRVIVSIFTVDRWHLSLSYVECKRKHLEKSLCLLLPCILASRQTSAPPRGAAYPPASATPPYGSCPLADFVLISVLFNLFIFGCAASWLLCRPL